MHKLMHRVELRCLTRLHRGRVRAISRPVIGEHREAIRVGLPRWADVVVVIATGEVAGGERGGSDRAAAAEAIAAPLAQLRLQL